MEFLRAALAYVEEGNWTYYIGGSNYNFNNNSDMEITTFSYCPSEYSVNDPGNWIFSIFTTIVWFVSLQSKYYIFKCIFFWTI